MYWTKLEYNTKWYFEEMAKSPHALIGGATGSGKSVALNGFIMHLLQKDPSEVNLILIDPKMVELRRYRKLPHVWKHATTSEDISEALIYAEWLMNERYKEMAESDDDELIYNGSDVYIIIDEYASLDGKDGMASKEALHSLREIAYKGRASKIHLIACTQRPTQDVISGMVKNNFTTMLALRTNTKLESRNLIELPICEELPDYGYGYFKSPSIRNPKLVEIEMEDKTFTSEVMNHWKEQKELAEEYLRG